MSDNKNGINLDNLLIAGVVLGGAYLISQLGSIVKPVTKTIGDIVGSLDDVIEIVDGVIKGIKFEFELITGTAEIDKKSAVKRGCEDVWDDTKHAPSLDAVKLKDGVLPDETKGIVVLKDKSGKEINRFYLGPVVNNGYRCKLGIEDYNRIFGGKTKIDQRMAAIRDLYKEQSDAILVSNKINKSVFETIYQKIRREMWLDTKFHVAQDKYATNDNIVDFYAKELSSMKNINTGLPNDRVITVICQLSNGLLPNQLCWDTTNKQINTIDTFNQQQKQIGNEDQGTKETIQNGFSPTKPTTVGKLQNGFDFNQSLAPKWRDCVYWPNVYVWHNRSGKVIIMTYRQWLIEEYGCKEEDLREGPLEYLPSK